MGVDSATGSLALPRGEATGRAAPGPTLSSADAVLIVVGVVVGAGIFKTPSMVAASAGTPALTLLLWLAGGAISLVGALCYAELVSAYPSAGGDYHFLARAFGARVAFFFAWARLMVLQTGSIALLSFVFGDYAAQLNGGAGSSAAYAALAVVLLTAVNVVGIRPGKWTQKILTSAEVLGLLLIVAAGFAVAGPAVSQGAAALPKGGPIGLALVFVLLTYGGWNEGAYLAAEVRGGGRSLARALLAGIAIITGIYLLVNLALLHGMGLSAVARSEAVAADLMRGTFGEGGARFVSVLVAISALTSANATIVTGARTNYALGRDFSPLRFLGRWRRRTDTPRNALLVQGAVALALVAVGASTRDGFTAMVEYTAPAFWLFFLLTGVSLFVLRRRDPGQPRPFRVPAYPVTPVLFCATAAFLFWSSVTYTGLGALLGVAVLLTGIPVLILARTPEKE
jgi:amino acid transporter